MSAAIDMPAGRDMDRVIGERVLGLKVIAITSIGSRGIVPEIGTTRRVLLPGGRPGTHADLLPAYSTDVGAAWAVVEAMQSRRFHAVVKSPFVPGEPYHAGFTPHGSTGWNGRPDHTGSGETAPLAICRAALAAVEVPRG